MAHDRHTHRRHPSLGLTLAEVMVVIAIVSILLALLMPAMQRVRQGSFRALCASNLRTIGMAGLTAYSLDHRGWTLGYNAYWFPEVANSTSRAWSTRLGQGDFFSLNYITWNRHDPAANATQRAWGVFRCPAESGALTGAEPINYGIYRHLSWPAFQHAQTGRIWRFQKQAYFLIRSVRMPDRLATVADCRTDSYFLDAYRGPAMVPTERHLSSGNFVFVDGHVQAIAKDQLPTGTTPAITPDVNLESLWPWGWK